LQGVVLTVGARSEVVSLRRSDVNLAEKVPRQVFAHVPGVLVYDMDGAGNQTNISTRGLDPHRSWEFNVRQDGVLVNSDIYGYPASHYSPPMEAMERVELLRGTAALQYGAQFGGLLNYRTRAPDTTRAFGVEGSLTGGSFGMRNGFASVGGRVGRIEYQAYGAQRVSDGYRTASESEYDAQYAALTYHASATLRIRAQVGRSYYLHRVPGPLTDSMFESDPRQATRTRNWFSPEIVVPALRLEWEPSAKTSLSAQVSALTGRRGSTLFVGFATSPDTVSSGEYAPRVVDIDDFDSRTAELRLLRRHRIGGRAATLVTGVTLAANHLHRRQQGAGSRGTGYDLNVTGAFGRDLHYRSRGFAWFAEEMVSVTPRWRVIPGVRIERGLTKMTGSLAYYDPADTPRRVRHDFPLFGLRSTYALQAGDELYGGNERYAKQWLFSLYGYLPAPLRAAAGEA
ncbi:MAG TPA: TonB-dependent receptor plug domain-containing protein, partial [Gemmatimonadaceae bacterium]|nr:TonB-dependent receptor plug domain-containing protein [Gemmatimonadaceae bacterium]